MKFLGWYVKIAIGAGMVGGAMEFFMIKTGFCVRLLLSAITFFVDDKVTVLESEKKAWENSPEAQAVREALNPWKNHDSSTKKSS